MQSGFRAFLVMVALSFMVGACSILGGKAAEEPAHRVVLKDGVFQIREYGAYAVAETMVKKSFETATREGFRLLFNYISGANRGKSKIDMTAPVLVAPERMAMTASPRLARDAPATLDDAAAGWTIAFVLPEGVTAGTAPRPANDRVALRDVPARRVAIMRFAGFFRNAVAETKRRELVAWLKVRGLAHRGDWRMAGYNPPWTLPSLRRNEVIVTLDANY